MNLTTLPNPTINEGEITPAWMEEPAKKVAAAIGALIAVLGVVLAAAAEVLPVLPEKARTAVAATIVTATAVLATLVRVQALLTRDRVFSPSTVEKIDPAALNAHEGS